MVKDAYNLTKIKKLMLILSITIVFTIFFAYAAEVIFEPPEYKCEIPRVPKLEINDATRQEMNDYYQSEEYQKCDEDYRTKRDARDFKSFILLTIVSIIVIILSFVIAKKEVVSSGVLGGGIVLLVYNVMRHWGMLNKYIRLLILGVALAVLIYYSYKKVDKKK